MITLRSRETISSRRFFFFLFFFFFFFFFFFLLLFFTPCIATSVLSFTFNGGKRGDFPLCRREKESFSLGREAKSASRSKEAWTRLDNQRGHRGEVSRKSVEIHLGEFCAKYPWARYPCISDGKSTERSRTGRFAGDYCEGADSPDFLKG